MLAKKNPSLFGLKDFVGKTGLESIENEEQRKKIDDILTTQLNNKNKDP